MKTNFVKIIYFAVMLLTGYACTYDVIPEVENCSTPPSLNILELNEANCGEDNGSIAVSAAGGAGNYEYSLSGEVFQQSGKFTGLAAGTYTIIVRDAANCTTTLETSVQNADGLNITAASTIAGCGTANGTITMDPVGGEAPVLFSLNNGSFQTNNVFEGLSSGTYTITAKDATDCEVTQEVEVLAGTSSTDIKSIIETNCAVSGCHAGNVSPDLRTLANIQDRAERIQIRTGNKTMPPASSSFSLTEAEIAAIDCWVEDGATNDNK
jgi:hypothetical protein